MSFSVLRMVILRVSLCYPNEVNVTRLFQQEKAKVIGLHKV